MVKIKDIPIFDRPYERLINSGVESLSNDELLAIIFKTGTKGMSSKELSVKLLSELGNIKKLNEISYEYLKNFNGIGMSKACNLLASIELGKRINREVDTLKDTKLNNPELVYKYYKDRLIDKKQEYFYCVYLDINKKVIDEKLLFIGTINYSVVHPREVFKEAYNLGASAIICVHNHPGNSPFPSSEDYKITKTLVKVGEILGVKVVDHVIICKHNYYSFLQNNDMVNA